MSISDGISKNIFSPIYLPFLLFIRVPILWRFSENCKTNLVPISWDFSHSCDTIFLVFFYYEQHIVFLVRHFILYSHSFCIYWILAYRWCIVFNEINTRASFSLVSFWFSSPSFVICNLLCLRTKILHSVAIP